MARIKKSIFVKEIPSWIKDDGDIVRYFLHKFHSHLNAVSLYGDDDSWSSYKDDNYPIEMAMTVEFIETDSRSSDC